MPDDANARGGDYDTDAIVARLMGSTLTGVRYFDTPLFTDQIDEEWPAAGPHAPGHGVDLCLDDRVVGVTWGHEELQLWPFSLVDLLLTGRFEAIPEKAPWSALIGRRIQHVRMHRLNLAGEPSSQPAPFALELLFENDEFVVLAAAGYEDANTPAFPGGTNIVVAWRPDHVRAALPDLVGPLGL